ncbi:MAG: 2-oxo acid dehydrogenase subunit E2, partial [Myxococcota bacterium]
PRADGRVFASPRGRRLARARGLDLSRSGGSGPRGRIVKRDLEGVQATPAPAAAAAAPAGAFPPGALVRLPPRVEKANATRKVVARRLTQAKQEVPHFYLTIDVDAAPMVALRKELNAVLDASKGEKISFNDIVIKAAAVALRRFPQANASWQDGHIHWHEVVDISVAVAIPDGLITPVIRDADHKGLLAISNEMKVLAGKAKDRKLQPEEFQGGTFSVSNLGMFGIEEFGAVINPPEGAILAVGGLRDVPVVKDGEVVPGKRMKVTMSCDHRVIDGAIGAQWLQVFQRLIESPSSLLL